jgi:ribose 5-phosphate isomerase A
VTRRTLSHGYPAAPDSGDAVANAPDLSAAELEREKEVAAVAAAALVEDGMTVGLGTGSTVAHLLPALARRRLSLRCVATSPRTEEAARKLGLHVEPFGSIERFDMTIDGADQVSPEGWLVKGGGGAHTREKVVAIAADCFIVIADSSKPVPRLHPPVPVELLEFGLASTMHQLGPVRRRDTARSPDGGVIADYEGQFGDPAVMAAWLASTPGVIGHGIFPPEMVSIVLVGHVNDVERIDITARPAVSP